MFSKKIISFNLSVVVERGDVDELYNKVVSVQNGGELTDELVDALKSFGFPVVKSRMT